MTLTTTVVSWMFVGLATAVTAATPCCPGSNLLNMEKTHCDEFPDAGLHINCNHSGIYILDPNFITDDAFTLDPVTGYLQSGHDIIQHEKFCLTRKLDENGTVSTLDIALVCFPEGEAVPANDHQYTIYSACVLISSFFLLVTLLVYMLVPELRDLQGKCLMCSMFSLCLAYISLAVLQLQSHNLSNTMCVSQAFFTYFWMLSAFFWLNVVSFNVWRTVIFHHFPLSDGQLLISFCVFAIGGPFLFLVVALATHHTPSANIIKPNFGVSSCWFDGQTEEWAYMYGPMAVLLFLNTLYFIWTAWRLWKDCRDQSAPRLRCLRFKCLLYLKLFIVMGIPWIFELISVIVDKSTGFWLVMDILNCLQGLIIFLILVVFRKKALRGLVKNRPWGFNCPKRWAAGVDEESEGMLAEEEELSQTQVRT
ncbi:G-protein coupled receptor Mth2-like isoform X2 [Zootermopsis nevadensis]|uniref:G-protein coupled receptor Mth2-like isoform X2 n=1 Tax=Zootermopsis nevadensis TaxID=136037 RepID=UPI000B8E21AB|nr:G-protein coupled receptor Mth2-like isoform X2 [Zootermopsis nevadensis]